MRLLLDSHAFLWFIAGNPRLSQRARSLIEDQANSRLLSIASLWELGIKVGLGRLDIGMTLPMLLREHVEQNAITILPIEPRHVLRVAALPNLHGDPFDRMLVAQALEDGLAILSADATLDAYGPVRTW